MEIETFISTLKPSLDLSTIQGSKMANIFFTIYTNKVPQIQNIIRRPRMLEKFFEVDTWVYSSLSIIDHISLIIPQKYPKSKQNLQ